MTTASRVPQPSRRSLRGLDWANFSALFALAVFYFGVPETMNGSRAYTRSALAAEPGRP